MFPVRPKAGGPLLGKLNAKKRLAAFSGKTAFTLSKPTQPMKSSALNETDKAKSDEQKDSEKKLPKKKKKEEKVSVMEQIRNEESRIKQALGTNLSHINPYTSHFVAFLDNPDSLKRLEEKGRNYVNMIEKRRQEELRKEAEKEEKRRERELEKKKREKEREQRLREKELAQAREAEEEKARRERSKEREERKARIDKEREEWRTPRNWREMKALGLTFEEFVKKQKEFGTSKNRLMHSVTASGGDHEGKYYPAKIVQYTKSKPSLSFSPNPAKVSEILLDRRGALMSLPFEVLDIMADIWSAKYLQCPDNLEEDVWQYKPWFESLWDLAGFSSENDSTKVTSKWDSDNEESGDLPKISMPDSLSSVVSEKSKDVLKKSEANVLEKNIASNENEKMKANEGTELNEQYEAFLESVGKSTDEEKAAAEEMSKNIDSAEVEEKSHEAMNTEEQSSKFVDSVKVAKKKKNKIAKKEKKKMKKAAKKARKEKKKMEKALKRQAKEEKKLAKMKELEEKEDSALSKSLTPSPASNKSKETSSGVDMDLDSTPYSPEGQRYDLDQSHCSALEDSPHKNGDLATEEFASSPARSPSPYSPKPESPYSPSGSPPATPPMHVPFDLQEEQRPVPKEQNSSISLSAIPIPGHTFTAPPPLPSAPPVPSSPVGYLSTQSLLNSEMAPYYQTSQSCAESQAFTDYQETIATPSYEESTSSADSAFGSGPISLVDIPLPSSNISVSENVAKGKNEPTKDSDNDSQMEDAKQEESSEHTKAKDLRSIAFKLGSKKSAKKLLKPAINFAFEEEDKKSSSLKLIKFKKLNEMLERVNAEYSQENAASTDISVQEKISSVLENPREPDRESDSSAKSVSDSSAKSVFDSSAKSVSDSSAKSVSDSVGSTVKRKMLSSDQDHSPISKKSHVELDDKKSGTNPNDSNSKATLSKPEQDISNSKDILDVDKTIEQDRKSTKTPIDEDRPSDRTRDKKREQNRGKFSPPIRDKSQISDKEEKSRDQTKEKASENRKEKISEPKKERSPRHKRDKSPDYKKNKSPDFKRDRSPDFKRDRSPVFRQER